MAIVYILYIYDGHDCTIYSMYRVYILRTVVLYTEEGSKQTTYLFDLNIYYLHYRLLIYKHAYMYCASAYVHKVTTNCTHSQCRAAACGRSCHPIIIYILYIYVRISRLVVLGEYIACNNECSFTYEIQYNVIILISIL